MIIANWIEFFKEMDSSLWDDIEYIARKSDEGSMRRRTGKDHAHPRIVKPNSRGVWKWIA